MRRFILAAALVAAPAAAFAQDPSGDGSNPFEEGAELFLRGLLDEMAPPLQELAGIGARHLLTLQAVAEELGPAFAEVFEQIDSITYYQPPEILPNGDIVFRRSPDAPPWQPAEAAPDPEPEPEESRPWFRRDPPQSEAPQPDEPDPETDEFRPNPNLGLEL